MESFSDDIIASADKYGVNFKKFEITNDTAFSCIMPYYFNQVEDAYKNENIQPLKIIDATANVGCDTINFRKMFPNAELVAIEISLETFKKLERNMSRIAEILPFVNHNRSLTIINDDCLNHVFKMSADVIYFDVPWGGADYYQYYYVDLFVSGQPLGSVIGKLLKTNQYKVIVAKTPYNIGCNKLIKDINKHTSFSLTKYEIHKPSGFISYYLMFFTKDD